MAVPHQKPHTLRLQDQFLALLHKAHVPAANPRNTASHGRSGVAIRSRAESLRFWDSPQRASAPQAWTGIDRL